MLSLTKFPFVVGLLSALSGTVALVFSPSLRSAVFPEQLTSLIPTTFLSYLLKFFGVVFLILNLKNVPTTWHIRVLRAIFYQVHLAPKVMTRQDLFKPLVTTSWNSPLDCDYNFHKSNSTYLKDLDVARAHYIGALLRTGLRRMHAGDHEGLPNPSGPSHTSSGRKVPDNYIIALGGVACIFRKEIAPLSRFEIWTRLLAWDEKWIYTVSHVVKAGAVRPRGYALQPWKDADAEATRFPSSLLQRLGLQRKSKPHPNKRNRRNAPPTTPISPSGNSSGDEKLHSLLLKEKDPQSEELRRAVYMTSIARYVCKKGRTVIAPEIVFERSHLLPTGPRPAYVPDLRVNHTFKGVPPVKSKSEERTNGHVQPNGQPSLSLDTSSARPTSGTTTGPESGFASIESQLGTAVDLGANAPSSPTGPSSPSSPGRAPPAFPRSIPGQNNATRPAQPRSVPKIQVDEVAGTEDKGVLSWDHVHDARTWGLKYAAQFDGLAGLHDTFASEGDEVLGVYGDLIY
ncbi:hypothetical protein KVT40_006528 [Elsinoe batatas]|uniref:Capsule polysaccharide biosynthesis protein n=1 Tax=Elsinoe batatas TaxID=2601811 RepID=A0A8K0KZ11_9PEZI|nr:hypothetical protein KVT40_006528 [Elsinoe batatas]